MTNKKSLSNFIRQAKESENSFSNQQVNKLVNSGKNPVLKDIRSYHPRKINRLLNPFKLIVMISIVGMICMVLIFNLPSEEKSSELRAQFSEKEETVLGTRYSVLGKEEVVSNEDTTLLLQDVTSKPKPVVEAEPIFIEDTCFNREILKLTHEQFVKLGFEFKETGFYYINHIGGKKVIDFYAHSDTLGGGRSSTSGFAQHGVGHYKYNQKPITSRSYFPICWSNTYGKVIRHDGKGWKEFKKQFELINDTLTPVLFKWSENKHDPKDDILLWFVTDKSFYQDLFDEDSLELYRNLELVKELVKTYPGVNRIDYNYTSTDPKIGKQIVLGKEYFSCFGISQKQDTVTYIYNYQGSANEIQCTTYGTSFRGILNESEMNSLGQRIVPPLFRISNDEHRGSTSITPSRYHNLDSTITRNDWIDLCVPVCFEVSPNSPIYATTFWFYACEELFSCLPDSIGIPMRLEYNRNVKPKLSNGDSEKVQTKDRDVNMEQKSGSDSLREESVPCEYFKSFCEGLPGLDNLNVYPNPATDQISIDIILNQGKTIEYRILDLAGRVLNDEFPRKTYSDGGRYTESMDISSLKSGMYLLVLIDKEGASMTKRVLKN